MRRLKAFATSFKPRKFFNGYADQHRAIIYRNACGLPQSANAGADLLVYEVSGFYHGTTPLPNTAHCYYTLRLLSKRNATFQIVEGGWQVWHTTATLGYWRG